MFESVTTASGGHNRNRRSIESESSMKALYLATAVAVPGFGTHTTFVEGTKPCESISVDKGGLFTVRLKNPKGQEATIKTTSGVYAETKEKEAG